MRALLVNIMDVRAKFRKGSESNKHIDNDSVILLEQWGLPRAGDVTP